MYLCLREAKNTGEKKVKLKLKETKVPRNSEQGFLHTDRNSGKPKVTLLFIGGVCSNMDMAF